MVLAIAASVTKGEALPEGIAPPEPLNVIFQTAEDGLGDTVKPRLIQAGADCSRVMVIDESEKALSLGDGRIEEALIKTGAKVIIFDPLQAFLGSELDMHRANEVRPLLKRIGMIAEKTGCAVIVVGHLNKSVSKSQYRGLGSIDIYAAARSVLTVGRIKGNQHQRAFAQGKNNLAPEGKSISFELHPDSGFRWIGVHPISIEELLSGNIDKETASERAQDFLIAELTGKTVPAKELFDLAEEQDIAERTLKRAKSILNVRSFKKDNKWYWTMDADPEKEECQDGYQESLASLLLSPESIGIVGLDVNHEKEGCQEYHIENLALLHPSIQKGGR